jgi:hypothetical protein
MNALYLKLEWNSKGGNIKNSPDADTHFVLLDLDYRFHY